MRKLRLGAAFLLILVLMASTFGMVAAQALELKIPNPTKEFYSNDFADIINADTESEIVSLGESVFNSTGGGQVVFVSIDTLGDSTIEEYANELFNKWKIGTEDKGVLFIISMQERRSRIEVGYGYEGILTDIESYRLIEKFSQLNQEIGMDEAVKTIYQDICSIVSGDGDSVYYPVTEEANTEDNFFSNNPILTIVIAVIVLFLIILDFRLTGGQITYFILRMAASSGRRGGGGGGHRNSGGGGRSGGGGASGGF
ncbi:MAG: hypothetical protein K0R84_515 [Clostridia bacterium]|jgi:uncharacterized protein|nr:hypothetical protein [Clostridia bacterium]